jgi:hypothetical protein
MRGGLLQAVGLLVAQHGVGLAGTRWPVGEDSGILAVEDGLDEWLDGLVIDMF